MTYKEFQTELVRLKERESKVRTTKDKALFVIESLTCNDEFADNPLLIKIYMYSHVANNICSNKHLDWKAELDKHFEALKEFTKMVVERVREDSQKEGEKK